MTVPAWLVRLLDWKRYAGRVRGPEDVLAFAVADALRAWTLDGRMLCTWSRIPHEVGYVPKGKTGWGTSRERYGKAKAQGFIPGSGELVFVGATRGCWIELKSEAGRLSDEQEDFRTWAKALGVPFWVARSVADVEAILLHEGMLK